MKVTVKKLGINGEGIAYIDKKPVFIIGALPNEIVDIKIKEKHDKYYHADLIKIIKASKDRIKVKCPYQEKCGGCSLMHMNYKAQSYYKRQLLVEALWKYGHVKEDLVRNIHTDDLLEAYRNSCKVPVQMIDGKLVSGMYQNGTNHFIPVDNCLMHNQNVEDARKKTLAILNKYHLNAFNKKYKKGIRYLVIRSIDEESSLTLVTGNDEIPISVINDLKKINTIKSISQSINTDLKTTYIFGNKTTILYGKETINLDIDNLKLELSPTSFFQLNTNQAKKLYQMAISKIDNCKTLIEEYAGIGTMSMLAYDKAEHIISIEEIPSAINNGQKCALKNKIYDKIEFICDDATSAYKKITKSIAIDTLLVDPPRSGMDEELLNLILQKPPKKIIYVSCNPSTLAKNLKVLKRYYQVRTIIPFDLFPNTPLVESVTVLTK